MTGLIRERGLDAHAISMMGVIEDLSDYPRVLERLAELVKPGGRIYLDYTSGKVQFGTSSFITKYVWPGTFQLAGVWSEKGRESPGEGFLNIFATQARIYI